MYDWWVGVENKSIWIGGINLSRARRAGVRFNTFSGKVVIEDGGLRGDIGEGKTFKPIHKIMGLVIRRCGRRGRGRKTIRFITIDMRGIVRGARTIKSGHEGRVKRIVTRSNIPGGLGVKIILGKVISTSGVNGGQGKVVESVKLIYSECIEDSITHRIEINRFIRDVATIFLIRDVRTKIIGHKTYGTEEGSANVRLGREIGLKGIRGTGCNCNSCGIIDEVVDRLF
jgi:hypothetical protein